MTRITSKYYNWKYSNIYAYIYIYYCHKRHEIPYCKDHPLWIVILAPNQNIEIYIIVIYDASDYKLIHCLSYGFYSPIGYDQTENMKVRATSLRGDLPAHKLFMIVN